jgi:hypothetical protein
MAKLVPVMGIFLFILPGFAQQATLTVTSPNGGESWGLGSPQFITWTYSGFTGNVTILLMKDGVRVGIIQDDVPVVSGRINWVAGQYRGGMAVAGTGYKIRIKRVGSDLLDNSNQPFTLTGLTAREPTPTTARPLITVTSPAGGESWPVGSTQLLRWKAENVNERVDVVLFRGEERLGKIIYGTIPDLPPFNWTVGGYSGGTAPTGNNYFIQVITVSGSVSDKNDTPFSITFPQQVAVEVETRLPPRLLDFRIDGGADRTESQRVRLDHRAMGSATHYRVQFEGAGGKVWSDWAPYVANPSFTFDSGKCGNQTLGLQLKNEYGESGVLTDAVYVAAKKEYRINGCNARSWCEAGRGWTFRIVETDCDDCAELEDNCTGGIHQELECRLRHPFGPQGAKAEFELFGGRELNEGWEFVAYEYECRKRLYHPDGSLPTETNSEHRIVQQPAPGSRNITLRVRIWTDFGTMSTYFRLKSITVKGPCDKPYWEAFQ